jgi:hypothetical protein
MDLWIMWANYAIETSVQRVFGNLGLLWGSGWRVTAIAIQSFTSSIKPNGSFLKKKPLGAMNH